MSAPKKTTFLMLQERFVASLERRVAHLQQCLDTLRVPNHVDLLTALDEMTRSFHSLAGIGGTYGFHDITEIARQGDLTCKSLDGQVNGKDVTELSKVIDSLLAAASSAAADVAARAAQAAADESRRAAEDAVHAESVLIPSK